MKFGLFYLFSEFGDVPQERIFSEVLEEIDYGEELGFDSVWLPEHHFSAQARRCLQLLKEEVGPRIADLTGT